MTRALVITGGSRGIGAATALKAARAGWAVAVNFESDAESAASVVSRIRAEGGAARAIQANVMRASELVRLFDAAEELGPIGGLINNAGITGKSSRLDAASEETIRSAIDINVTGAIFAAREAVKRMSPRHGGKGGVIVNLSSAAANLGSPGEYTWYAASKGAIDSFTIGLAREVADEGIRVVAVAPGLIDTEIHEKSSGDGARVGRLTPMIPLKRIGRPEEVADLILYALSDAASYITGTTLRISGGR